MKTSKKVLSVILALMILVSSISVSAVAFAAEKEQAVKDVETMITNYNGKLSIANPSEKDLKDYEDICTAFKKLSNDQRQNFDDELLLKLIKAITDREKQLSIEANPTIGKYDKQHYANATSKIETILGNLDFLAGAKELGATIQNKASTTDAKIAMFESKTAKERLWSNYWNDGYQYFTGTFGYSSTQVITDLSKEIAAPLIKNNPYAEEEVKALARPSDKNYPDGKNDPEYIKDFAKYMDSSKKAAEWKCRKSNYEQQFQINAFYDLAAKATEFAATAKLLKDAFAAVNAFEENESNTKLAANVVKYYETLSGNDKLFADNLAIYVRYEPKEYTTSWSTSSMKLSGLYTMCVDIGNIENVTEFIDTINNISKPYTNDKISTAKKAFEKVPSSLLGRIPDEVNAKYKEILASIQPDEQLTVKPDLSAFDKTNVAYPSDLSKEQVNQLIVELNKLAGSFTAGLPEMVKTGVYTNATVSMIAQVLFPLLAGVNSMISYGPNDLARKLVEDKFAGAVNSLDAITTKDENGRVVKNIDDWAKLTFKNGDMGFQDGDKEGFLDAVSALFRPASIITAVITLENKIDTNKGTYTYGAYEDLVPIFETLDLDGVMSSHEYTLYGQEQVKNNSNLTMDAKIRPILVPVFNLIDSIAADPINGLLSFLPKLGALLKDDLLDTQIHKLASKLSSLITLPEFSLKTADIFNMIAPKLSDLSLNLGGKDVKLSITLNQAKFVSYINDIAGCGNGAVKDSKTRENAYRLGINSDNVDSFMTTYRWLYSEISTKSNLKSIKTIINSLDLAFTDKLIATMAVEFIGVMGADKTLSLLASAILPKDTTPIPDEPTTKPEDTTNKNETTTVPAGSVDSNTNATQNGSSSNKGEGVPSTGDYSIGAFVGLTALAGIALVLTKKKKEN